MKIPTQYWLIMPRGQFKAMRQCKWCRLVINASLQLMEVAPPGGQICNQFKWCQVMMIFKTLYWASESTLSFVRWNEAQICLQMAGGAILWPNLQLFQVVPSDGKTDPVVCTLKWSTNPMERNFGNQKMLIGMKYKSVFFQKYCKSEKEKYFNISVKI